VELRAGDAVLRLDLARGGRIASFRVGGRELLIETPVEPLWWGSFPMVPFAGRIRDGRFAFRGRDYQLAPNNPPHAIHGTAFERAWRPLDATTIETELGDGWPFRGRVLQRFDLQPDRLDVELVLEALDAMPAMLGWHPWFRRRLGEPLPPSDARADAEPAAGELRLQFAAGAMYERGSDGMPSGELVPTKPRPWDDCFTRLEHDPILEWPGVLRLAISSSLDHWVVFDELARGICVEPQSGPPNEINMAPQVLEAGERLGATMTWRWEVPLTAAADPSP